MCISRAQQVFKPAYSRGMVAQLFNKCPSAMPQAAALSRLAMLLRFALDLGRQREWPLRHTASEGHRWAATLAAATSAAAFWANEAANSIAASSAGASNGGSSGDGADASTPPHPEAPQRHRFMQHAACYLGKAVELLLPPAATASLDALEQEPLPSLLAALAEVCCMTPESLQLYAQVLQHACRPDRTDSCMPSLAPARLP
jgi:hypothetical protein